MARGRREKLRLNWTNKVHWPITKKNELEPCKQADKIVPLISKDGLEMFQTNVNDLIFTTLETTSPMHLRFGGQFLGLLVIILGVVCLGLGYFVVGAVLAILGVMFACLGFWYRQQLIRRAWKKIGQHLAKEFKRMGEKFPGVSYEFHVEGHHRTKDIRDKKGNIKKKGHRRGVFYDRYIIIYLPGDASHYHDYVEDKRSVAAILKGDSTPVQERQDLIDDNPLTLPYWWATAKTRDGKSYYINNLRHTTQWAPPTLEQLVLEKAELKQILAPPGQDDFSTDSDDDDDTDS